MLTDAKEYAPVTSFAQLKPGCAIRSSKYPWLTGTFKFEGHGLAVIRLDVLGRDSLCELKDIEVKVEVPAC